MINLLSFSKLVTSVLLVAQFISSSASAAKLRKPIKRILDQYSYSNNIPPRYQWENNSGYCGEVSLISAGLYYGQYASQYDIRAIAGKGLPQNKCQVLVGNNDQYTALQMRLKAVEWTQPSGTGTPEFLTWVKSHVVSGFPVIIGIFTNEYLFYSDSNPDAGQPDYDHIVPVIGISSNHSLQDPNYYADDTLTFSDNGLWGTTFPPQYLFSFQFADFQKTRREANARNGSIYSIVNNGNNYGVAITGVVDLDGDTLPVRVTTDLSFENPQIQDGSNNRPSPEKITLTITVSQLQPGISYMLYRYSDFASVPVSKFNANSHSAAQSWPITISSGSSFSMTEVINSNEIAVYRVVRSSSP